MICDEFYCHFYGSFRRKKVFPVNFPEKHTKKKVNRVKHETVVKIEFSIATFINLYHFSFPAHPWGLTCQHNK